MANPFTLKLQGFADLENNLRTATDRMLSELDREEQASAETIVRDAQRDAPVNVAELRRSITFIKNKELSYSIVAQSEYAAFMEWGTKTKIRIPAEYAGIAAQYKQKGGSFSDLLRAILLWVHQKGITGRYSVKTRKRLGSKKSQAGEDMAVAYAIARSIAIKGVNPHPFFFHNFDKERPQLLKRAEEILRRNITVLLPDQINRSSRIITI